MHDIGLGLVTHILEKHENAFVYAGVRDPDNASSLQNLRVKYSDRIAVVKCVSADVEGNAALGKEIGKRHGHLDTVIANAGMSLVFYISSLHLTFRMKVSTAHALKFRKLVPM